MAQYCLPCSDWDICCIGLCTYISGFTSTRSVFIFNNFKNQFRLTDKRLFLYREVGCETEMSTYSIIAGLWASMYSLG